MKKIIAVILASLMLLSLCACAKDTHDDAIDAIGGADGPTAILVAGPSESPEK